MTHDQLMVAAKVFELAVKIHDRAFERFVESIPNSDETKEAQVKNWLSKNNHSAFVPDAYALLSKVAGMISEIQLQTSGTVIR